MGTYLLKLPKMGESVAEATITNWLKEEGDTIAVDESVVEIATDKVDSDVPSEVAGILIEKKFAVDAVVQVGEVMAVIQTDGPDVMEQEAPSAAIVEATPASSPAPESTPSQAENDIPPKTAAAPQAAVLQEEISSLQQQVSETPNTTITSKRFYSPLVKNIAKQEGISLAELEQIPGSGSQGRVTKKDILAYIAHKPAGTPTTPTVPAATTPSPPPQAAAPTPTPTMPSGKDQIIEMTRMGKLIADHMIKSKATSAHVQSFVEADVTQLWEWREAVKEKFHQRTGEKLTFTPLFITALVKALRDFPLLNSAVDGAKIIQKGAINIGMATALADGNLIVPVIKNADHLNLVGMAKSVNELARKARSNELKPDDIQDGTYTLTNVGHFGSIMGTPIINQPQVGILAIGAIRKMPAVIETAEGDFIGIRQKLILSHSYDHRIINGAMGSQFVKNVADYLENWNEPLPF